ncbi:MOSC domain-containing protein [Amylibacter sp.]|nr:MOSC domain-containing protein [Amylibacter sp.]MDB9892411.1 MOSC domain-containing protein [Amylibacter sp.]
MGSVANLWRHPIKGVGREELKNVTLESGRCMPMDRNWAIAHENSKVNFQNPEWASCLNFVRAASNYELMAISSCLNEESGLITLKHPKLNDLTIDPDVDSDKLVNWLIQICNPNRSLPLKVFKTNRGITDTSVQTISIHTNSTLEDLSKSMNKPLDQRCFRGNIWLNGEAAWSEFDWIGKVIRIGTAELEIIEPIERCMATTLDPETAISNADTLNTLNKVYGHQNFGVFGIVSKSGYIKINDKAELV